ECASTPLHAEDLPSRARPVGSLLAGGRRGAARAPPPLAGHEPARGAVAGGGKENSQRRRRRHERRCNMNFKGEIDRELIRRKGGSSRFAKLRIEVPAADAGHERAPLNIAIVIDRSGS